MPTLNLGLGLGPTRSASAPALRILLADDNEIIRRAYQGMLTRLGHEVDVVSNGREVLDAALLRDYDVVLLDLQMPEMDGLEAARSLNSGTPERLRPRIIALTASDTVEDRALCLASGMDDCLAKPVRVEQLIEALHRGHPRNGARSERLT